MIFFSLALRCLEDVFQGIESKEGKCVDILSQLVHGRVLKINTHSNNALATLRHETVDGPEFRGTHARVTRTPTCEDHFLGAKKAKYDIMHLKT